jgi:5-methylcytosine-specific restriction endonuclease McrA
MTGTRKKKRKSATTIDWDRCKAWFGYRCAYCGKAGKLTKDHIIPRYHGGGDMVLNLIPACQSCNSSKGKKNVDSWYREQSFYSPFREQLIRQYLIEISLKLIR